MIVVGSLEYEPELVAGIGLLTVRWATLEYELAGLLGEFTKTEKIGRALYYSVGSFGQRMSMVEAAAKAGLVYPHHKAIADKLADVIKRLWKTRNYLVHSHYGYANEPGPNPTSLQTMGPPVRDGRTETPGYFSLGRDKLTIEFSSVSKGTFQGHSDAVARRTLHVHRFALAIARQRVRLMPAAMRGFAKWPPR